MLVNNKRANINNLQYQQGVVLVTSLLILVMVTIIAASAFKTSYIQTLIAGNVKNQTVSFNIAERILRIAENDLEQEILNPVPFDIGAANNGYYNLGEDVNVDQLDWDTAANVITIVPAAVPGVSNGQYIIQYFGEQVDAGGDKSISQNGGGSSGDKVHVFVITARSLDKKRAERIVQSVYVTLNKP